MAVDDDLDGDVARCGRRARTRAPLRLHTTGRGRTGCRLGQQACGLHRRSQHSGTLESQFAPVRARLHAVDGEIHQMTEPVGHIRTADAHTFAPRVVGQRLRQMNVRTAPSNARISDTREIGFAADPSPVPAIQRVIPDIQLVNEGGVSGGDEIHHIVRDIHDVLVRADAAEGRQLVVRQVSSLNLQTVSRVGEPDDRSLRLRPFQNRQIPGRPVLDLPGVGIVLLA